MMALENEKQLRIFSTIVKYVIFKINNVSFSDISPNCFEVNHNYA